MVFKPLSFLWKNGARTRGSGLFVGLDTGERGDCLQYGDALGSERIFHEIAHICAPSVARFVAWGCSAQFSTLPRRCCQRDPLFCLTVSTSADARGLNLPILGGWLVKFSGFDY